MFLINLVVIIMNFLQFFNFVHNVLIYLQQFLKKFVFKRKKNYVLGSRRGSDVVAATGAQLGLQRFMVEKFPKYPWPKSKRSHYVSRPIPYPSRVKQTQSEYPWPKTELSHKIERINKLIEKQTKLSEEYRVASPPITKTATQFQDMPSSPEICELSYSDSWTSQSENSSPSTPASRLNRISTPVSSSGGNRCNAKEDEIVVTPTDTKQQKKDMTSSPEISELSYSDLSWTSQSENSPASTASDRTTPALSPVGNAKEDKIVVTVRLRPLSKREQAAKDQLAWECIDDHIVVPINVPSIQPSFTFDKVFGPLSLTETVYEEGVKNVALSALMGINATIFAYGQTSSGKTYNMREIREKAVTDIYNHIMNTPERDFTIKISGLEIYNETVRDLLNFESGLNLKLFDDPKKGTVVEKLIEETANNANHLRNLISICEAHRQVGETALNDKSSRSHQIIRLTIQSTLRESSGQSYVASLNFVDLAGNERVAQTVIEGTRFREACHINRSLMTLTTVIQKLSDGGKRSHIPYRDSKLTRILQHSLGGNARTAIICTLSPAMSHFEQSRNTLYFATRAKEVTNNAHVNMVVSDKQLVKKLQKEVSRLEAELRTPDVSEKDMKIQLIEKEIEALRRQRDTALSEVEELRQKVQLLEQL